MTKATAAAPIQLFDAPSGTYTYILMHPETRDAIIIDPVEEQIDRDLEVLKSYNLNLRFAVETHAHADHITSAAKLVELTGAKTAAPADCGITTANIQLKHGDTLACGTETLKALHTPGHTGGSMCFVWGDHVFVEERTVDVHIRRLRSALEPTQYDALIQTVRGKGYRWYA